MKKSKAYYAFFALISASMSILSLWAMYQGILPTIMFALLITGCVGSTAIACYELERIARSKSKSKWEIRVVKVSRPKSK